MIQRIDVLPVADAEVQIGLLRTPQNHLCPIGQSVVCVFRKPRDGSGRDGTGLVVKGLAWPISLGPFSNVGGGRVVGSLSVVVVRDVCRERPSAVEARVMVQGLAQAWVILNGMLTPSLKLKRRNVVTRYNDAIEALYRQAEAEGVRAA